MADLLVKLYTLPRLEPLLERQRAMGIEIRRALAPEKQLVVGWVENLWADWWASECAIAFARQPLACFIAVDQARLVGFACYEATAKNFFGPTGVAPAYRNRGIGTALLVASLQSMAAAGYAYAIIGGVGPAAFYASAVGAVLIEDSTPGIYQGMLRSAGQAGSQAPDEGGG